jgi:hypothetical protein
VPLFYNVQRRVAWYQKKDADADKPTNKELTQYTLVAEGDDGQKLPMTFTSSIWSLLRATGAEASLSGDAAAMRDFEGVARGVAE